MNKLANVWDEEWFVNLPKDYKLFYLWAENQADQTGVWVPKKSVFQRSVIDNAMVDYDSFLEMVNKNHDEDDSSVRIRTLENNRWFFTNRFTEQLGHTFKPTVGAHRGALKMLVMNDIHPKEIPNFDWRGLQDIEIEDLKKIAYGLAIYRQGLDDVLATHAQRRKINDNRLLINDNSKEGGAGGNKKTDPDEHGFYYDFPLKELYLKNYDQLREIPGIKYSEEQFNHWKEFVDHVKAKEDYQQLFITNFVPPKFFHKLITEGFTKDEWDGVIEEMLGTGMKPEHDLFYRIKKFRPIYHSKKNRNEGGQNTKGLTGKNFRSRNHQQGTTEGTHGY